MSRFGILRGLIFFVYLFFQVLILKNAVLFHTAFCFLYVAYLLTIPVETNPLVLMLAGFALGFLVDMFYDSLGLHAMACVFIMYFRNYWLTTLTPQGGYDSNTTPSIAEFGLQWFLTYVIPLIFIHHTLLFFTEAGGFDYFWHTVTKIVASTLFTVVVVLLTEYLFPQRRS